MNNDKKNEENILLAYRYKQLVVIYLSVDELRIKLSLTLNSLRKYYDKF